VIVSALPTPVYAGGGRGPGAIILNAANQ